MWSFPPWGTSSGSEKQNQEGSPSPQSRTKDCDFRGPSCKSELQSVIYSLGRACLSRCGSPPLRLRAALLGKQLLIKNNDIHRHSS